MSRQWITEMTLEEYQRLFFIITQRFLFEISGWSNEMRMKCAAMKWLLMMRKLKFCFFFRIWLKCSPHICMLRTMDSDADTIGNLWPVVLYLPSGSIELRYALCDLQIFVQLFILFYYTTINTTMAVKIAGVWSVWTCQQFISVPSIVTSVLT